jgi:acetyl esterase/lipase
MAPGASPLSGRGSTAGRTWQVPKQIKLEVPAGQRIPAVGDRYHGGVVVASFPEIGDPNIIVEVGDDYNAAALDAHVVDHRPIHTDYGPVSVAAPTVLAPAEIAFGEAARRMGITDEVRKRGNWGAGRPVYVGDTGADFRHQAFAAKAGNVTWWAADHSPSHDYVGHGTWCLSVLGGTEPWGVCTDAPVGMFLFLEQPDGRGTEPNIANAFRAAVNARIQSGVDVAVLSLSLGGTHSSVIDAAVQFARDHGVLSVCAAGNEGPFAVSGSPADAPATWLVVGATTLDGEVADFSTGGSNNPLVRVFAPGVDLPGAQAGTLDGVKYDRGTSMATPYVAAAAHLLLCAGLSPDEALAYILSHQEPVSPPAANGHGRLVMQPDFGAADGASVFEPAPPPVLLPPPPIPAAPPVGHSDRVELIIGDDPRDKLTLVVPRGRAVVLVAPDSRPGAAPGMPAYPGQNGHAGAPGAHPLAAGVHKFFYGPHPRQTLVVRVPAMLVSDDTTILWAGGAWQSGGDAGAVPLTLQPQSAQLWYGQQGRLVIMPGYRLFNIQSALEDTILAVQFVHAHCAEWGGSPDKLVLSGHSAGGWSAVVGALRAGVPVKAVIGLSTACLMIDGSWAFTQLGQIIRQPWGNPAHWAEYSAHTHLFDSDQRFPIWLAHALNDMQIPIQMVRSFGTAAQAAQYPVSLTEMPPQFGGPPDGHGVPGDVAGQLIIQRIFQAAWAWGS